MQRLAVLSVLFAVLLPAAVRAQTPSTPPSSFAALKAVALNQTDLIGYALESEDDGSSAGPPPRGVVAAYFAVWGTVNPTPAVVGDDLVTANSVAVARQVFDALQSSVTSNPSTQQVQDLGSQGIGDQDDAQSFQVLIGRAGAVAQAYQETVRLDVVNLTVAVIGNPGAVSLQNAVAYARIVAGRITAAQGPSAAQPAPSAGPSPAPHGQPGSATAPIAPAFQPQGLVALAAQYVTGGGYAYAGDCSQVTADNAGSICTLMYGPDAGGNYTISYSVVGDDGTPEPPFGSQTVSPDQVPAPSTAPVSSPSPVPVDSRTR
jgi:hypothetical protein